MLGSTFLLVVDGEGSSPHRSAPVPEHVGPKNPGHQQTGNQQQKPAQHAQHAQRTHGTGHAHGTVTERNGQNPWVVSEQQLRAQGNAHATASQVEAFDKQMAAANPDVYSYAGDSAEHIPAGTELKVPRH
jgi:hypothetical protein